MGAGPWHRIDQPAEHHGGKCSSCGIQGQIPHSPLHHPASPQCWGTSPVFPFQNERHNMIVIYLLYLDCINHLPKAAEIGAIIAFKAIVFLLIVWNNRAIFSKLSNKDTLTWVIFLRDFMHQQVPAGSSTSWSPYCPLQQAGKCGRRLLSCPVAVIAQKMPKA